MVTLAPVTLGRLWQDREKGHLMQIEIADVLVEISTRGRLDAKTATPERDLVEIKLENFLLGQYAFDTRRQDHLLQLARDRIFIAKQQVLGHLLGDRRSAYRTLARTELDGVIDNRVGRAGDVDAGVTEERLVFRRKEGFDQPLRKIHILELYAPLACVGIHNFAVDPAHHGRQRCLVFQQRFGVRQVPFERCPTQH